MRETDFLGTIESVRSAALDPAEWSTALTSISDLLRGYDATLEVHTTEHPIPLSIIAGSRIPSDGLADYLGYYSKVCPRLDINRSRSLNNPGHVGFDYDFMSEAELDADEFYSDFLAPYDLRYFMSAIMARRGEIYTGLYLHRTPSQGHVNDEEVSLMRRIVPHVTAAHDIHTRLRCRSNHRVDIESVLETLDFGALLLDHSGRVLFANDTANGILNAADGLTTNDNKLTISDVLAASSFSRILKTMFDGSNESRWGWGGDLQASRPSPACAYHVSVRRLPKSTRGLINRHDAAAIVFVDDPLKEAPIGKDALIVRFGLTEAEADVALTFAKCGDIFEIAQKRAVSISTVRSQLYTVMEKLSVHSQVNLMRFLASTHEK